MEPEWNTTFLLRFTMPTEAGSYTHFTYHTEEDLRRNYEVLKDHIVKKYGANRVWMERREVVITELTP